MLQSQTVGHDRVAELNQNITLIEIKCTINVMHLNHPQIMPLSPTQSMEELSPTKLIPGTKKIGDH